MNLFVSIPLAAALGAAVVLAPADRKEVVAHVGGGRITLGAMAERLEAISPFMRKRFADPAARRELLEEMIRFKVLVDEARRRGLEEDPAVVRAGKQAAIEALRRARFEGTVGGLEKMLAHLRETIPFILYPKHLHHLRTDGAGPRDLGEHAGAIVARVAPAGGWAPIEVALSELQTHVDTLPSDALFIAETERGRAKILRDAVDFELLAHAAAREGFDYAAAASRARHDKMLELLLLEAKGSVTRESVTDDEARRYYDARLRDFSAPEARRLRHLVLAKEAVAKKLAKTLRGAPADRWSEVAKEHASEGVDGATSGVMLPWVIESGKPLLESDEDPGLPKKVVKTAWKLESAGDIAVVEGPAGWHVVALVFVRPAIDRSFESVRAICVEAVLGEKRGAALERVAKEARERSPVRVREDVLRLVDVR